MIGAATEASISSTKICSLAVAEPSPATEPAGSSTEVCIDWIDASLSLKALSTRSESAAISVFLAGMFLWAQSAASSSDWSCATVASNCSRSFADCSVSSVARAGRSDLSRGPEAEFVDRILLAAVLSDSGCMGAAMFGARSLNIDGRQNMSMPAGLGKFGRTKCLLIVLCQRPRMAFLPVPGFPSTRWTPR